MFELATETNYGYKNLRGFLLLIDLCGHPYIDVRVSFNSFIPSEVDEDLSERLVDLYIAPLIQSPSYHDKVEFEVFGKKDIERIKILEARHPRVLSSDLDLISKIYWSIEDCKRHGTLPFANLARAGFIAMQTLKSLLRTGILNQQEYEGFMSSLHTVSSRMSQDLIELNREEVLVKYGHLRPGAYDILSTRYDEGPDNYFNWADQKKNQGEAKRKFLLSLDQLTNTENLLKTHRLELDVIGLFDFIRSTIEGREYVKFLLREL